MSPRDSRDANLELVTVSCICLSLWYILWVFKAKFSVLGVIDTLSVLLQLPISLTYFNEIRSYLEENLSTIKVHRQIVRCYYVQKMYFIIIAVYLTLDKLASFMRYFCNGLSSVLEDLLQLLFSLHLSKKKLIKKQIFQISRLIQTFFSMGWLQYACRKVKLPLKMHIFSI